MWHTLMALPGQSNLARHDLYGLRPRTRRPIEDMEVLHPRRTLISPIPRGGRLPATGSTTATGHIQPQIVRGNNCGHVTSVTQTLQNRMATAAEAAAARARVTKRI